MLFVDVSGRGARRIRGSGGGSAAAVVAGLRRRQLRRRGAREGGVAMARDDARRDIDRDACAKRSHAAERRIGRDRGAIAPFFSAMRRARGATRLERIGVADHAAQRSARVAVPARHQVVVLPMTRGACPTSCGARSRRASRPPSRAPTELPGRGRRSAGRRARRCVPVAPTDFNELPDLDARYD